MPANVIVNDDRWQFIAGNKYWVIAKIVLSGTYVTGGIPFSFDDPTEVPPNILPPPRGLVKASRAPWFAVIQNDSSGNVYSYITPSERFGIDPPNTVGTVGPDGTLVVGGPIGDRDNGLLKITSGGTEVANGTALTATTYGLFIFQGME